MHFKTNVSCRKRMIGKKIEIKNYFLNSSGISSAGCVICLNEVYWGYFFKDGFVGVLVKTEKCKEEIQRDWNLRKEYMSLKKLISNAESKKEKRRI